MSRDWAHQDFYGLLGVTPDATAGDLKRAYRRLAQLHHPDANPGDPNATGRFRAIATAYGILSDPAQRAAYDQIQVGQAPVDSTLQDENVGGLFSAAVSGSVLGRHIITSATLPLEEAARGASVRVSLDNSAEISVTLPPGVDDGDIVRITGRGHADPGGGPAGDLIVIVHIPRHPKFERNGLDLTVRAPVSLSHAAMGGDLAVPTLHGSVTMNLPAGSRIGARFRIEGYGIQAEDGSRGDLYVVLEANSGDTMPEGARRGSFAGFVDVMDEAMEVIPTVGELFDPTLHEAVRVAEQGEGRLVVTGEVRRGYRVRGQVIRPALVTVAYQREGTQP